MNETEQNTIQDNPSPKKNTKKIVILSLIAATVITVGAVVGMNFSTITSYFHYNSATKHLESQEYLAAAQEFAEAGDYKDSVECIVNIGETLLDQANYSEAIDVLQLYPSEDTHVQESITYAKGMIEYNNKNWDQAISTLVNTSVRDSKDVVTDATYQCGLDLYNAKQYSTAIIYLKQVINYKDASTLYKNSNYEVGLDLFNQEKYLEAAPFFGEATGVEGVEEYSTLCFYYTGKNAFETGNMEGAITYLSQTAGYEDTDTMVQQASYKLGQAAYDAGDYASAQTYFTQAGNYSSAAKYAKNAGYLVEYKDAFEKAEKHYAAGELNQAKAIYNTLPKDMFMGSVKVSSRLSTLKKYDKFVKMCGSWSRSGGKMKVYCYGYYNTWWYYRDSYGTLEIRCIIKSNGKVEVKGNVDLEVFTDYYSQNYTWKGKSFDKTVSKSFKNFKSEGVKVKWDGKKWTLSYSKSLGSDGYFRYKSTATAKLKRYKAY